MFPSEFHLYVLSSLGFHQCNVLPYSETEFVFTYCEGERAYVLNTATTPPGLREVYGRDFEEGVRELIDDVWAEWDSRRRVNWASRRE